MTDGRTIWFPLDTGWWRREHVVELGEEFGPVGPAVLMWLSCEAKLQNDGGRVKAGPRTVARGVFTDAVTVGHVLSRAVSIGALHRFEEHDGRFTCSISGWERDNQRGGVSFRKADSRAKTAPVVTVGHAESRSVTVGHEREEKSREETTPQTPQGGVREIARELFAYWQQRCRHEQAKPQGRVEKIEARLKQGYTPAQIRKAIDGAAVAAFVDDKGKRHDDLTLICRNGPKLEDFIERAGSAKVRSMPRRTLTECRMCKAELTSASDRATGRCLSCDEKLMEGAA